MWTEAWMDAMSDTCHTRSYQYLFSVAAPCGLRGCKNRTALFPGRMLYKAAKPGLVLFYILACFIMLLFIRAPFYVLLVFIGTCSVFWLLFWLSCQYLPRDWLERFLWGSLTAASGSYPECPAKECLWYDFLVYSIVSLFYCMVVLFPCPTWYTLYFYDTIQPVCAENAVKQQ